MSEPAPVRPRSPSPPNASSQSSPATSDYPSDPNMNAHISQPFTSWPPTLSAPDVKPPAASLLLEDVLQEDAFSASTDQSASSLNFPDFHSPSLQLYPLAAQPQDSVTQQLMNFHSLGLQSPTGFNPLHAMVKQEHPPDAHGSGLLYPLSQDGSPTDYSTSYFYSTSHPQTPASSSESPQPASAAVDTQYDPRGETEIVYPSPSVTGLKIALPSIPVIGAKSRVETQIKVVLQLTMPDGDPLAGRRVGTWKWIKLEKGAALRKRPRNMAKNAPEPKPNEVLQLVATVHPASQPSLTAYRCASCHQREVKRTARKLALRVRPPVSPSPHGAPNSKLRENAEEELDDKRMVIFNCADLQELRDGEVSLPTRLVCYCRHHREKLGFIVVFQMFAEGGRIVAEGISPPIMITDDHKSRNPQDADSSASRFDVSGQASASEELPPKRRRALDDGTESQQERRPRKKNRSAASTPPMEPQQTSPSHILLPLPLSPLDAVTMNNDQVPSNIAPLAPSMFSFPQALANAISMPPPSLPTHPRILRLIPPTGPVAGGIEVTLLGQAFSLTTAPVFGNVAATSWTPYGENAMVCILPPSPCPGPVRVTLQGIDPVPGEEPAVFCYEDHSDKALMELALQVVGLKMNGRIDNARDVAMQIMVSGRSAGPDATGVSRTAGMPFGQHIYRTSRSNGSAHSTGRDFQSTVMSLMRLLEAPLPSRPVNAAYLSRTGPTGLTLLHLAVILNFKHLCKQLISLGVDLDARDINGYTALHFAALNGRLRMARLLIEAGADISIVDGLGHSATDIARAHDEVDVMELCEEYALDHPDDFDGVDADESGGEASSDVSCDRSPHEDVSSEGGSVLPTVPMRRSNATSLISSPSMLSSSTITQEFEELPPLPDEPDFDLAEPTPESPNSAPPPYSYWPSTLVEYSAAFLQKALQLHTAPYVGQWEKMPSVVPNVPWDKMAQQLHLPTMPLIFQVSVPSWPPSLSWPTTTSSSEGEKSPVTTESKTHPGPTWWQRQEGFKGPMSSERSGLSHVQVDGNSPAGPEVLSGPAKTVKRAQYDQVEVTDGEINSYAYQASTDGRRVRKNDRMLILFWIPILIIVLAWAVIKSLPYAYSAVHTTSQLLSSRLVPI